jgi:hypothetical protein
MHAYLTIFSAWLEIPVALFAPSSPLYQTKQYLHYQICHNLLLCIGHEPLAFFRVPYSSSVSARRRASKLNFSSCQEHGMRLLKKLRVKSFPPPSDLLRRFPRDGCYAVKLQPIDGSLPKIKKCRIYCNTRTRLAPRVRSAIGTSTTSTLRTFFEINAVHTKPTITTSAVPLPTTIEAVTPFTPLAQRTNAIHIIIILTAITVIFHAVLTSVILCSVLINSILLHF